MARPRKKKDHPGIWLKADKMQKAYIAWREKLPIIRKKWLPSDRPDGHPGRAYPRIGDAGGNADALKALERCVEAFCRACASGEELRDLGRTVYEGFDRLRRFAEQTDDYIDEENGAWPAALADWLNTDTRTGYGLVGQGVSGFVPFELANRFDAGAIESFHSLLLATEETMETIRKISRSQRRRTPYSREKLLEIVDFIKASPPTARFAGEHLAKKFALAPPTFSKYYSPEILKVPGMVATPGKGGGYRYDPSTPPSPGR